MVHEFSYVADHYLKLSLSIKNIVIHLLSLPIVFD